jgi:hypothetical protein
MKNHLSLTIKIISDNNFFYKQRKKKRRQNHELSVRLYEKQSLISGEIWFRANNEKRKEHVKKKGRPKYAPACEHGPLFCRLADGRTWASRYYLCSSFFLDGLQVDRLSLVYASQSGPAQDWIQKISVWFLAG